MNINNNNDLFYIIIKMKINYENDLCYIKLKNEYQ